MKIIGFIDPPTDELANQVELDGYHVLDISAREKPPLATAAVYTCTQIPMSYEGIVLCPMTNVDHLRSPYRNPTIIHLDETDKDFLFREVHATAEHTVSLMLQLLKLHKDELFCKKVLILGYGRVGHQVEAMLQGFGATTVTVDNRGEYRRIRLSEPDIITMHTPGDKQIDLFPYLSDKVRPYIINTSRGKCLDGMRLYCALMAGAVKGFALDVTDNYSWDTLGKLQGLCVKRLGIITLHIAGNTEASRRKTDLRIWKKFIEREGV